MGKVQKLGDLELNLLFGVSTTRSTCRSTAVGTVGIVPEIKFPVSFERIYRVYVFRHCLSWRCSSVGSLCIPVYQSSIVTDVLNQPVVVRNLIFHFHGPSNSFSGEYVLY
jgi:hypothetical protein